MQVKVRDMRVEKNNENIEERKRISLFDHRIPHAYMGLNRREHKLIMERKILGDYNKIKSKNKIVSVSNTPP